MSQLPVACALICDLDGKVLLLRREDRSMADLDGLWELPGGKVEFGEDPEAAAVREVLEETGLAVKVTGMVPLVYTNIWEHPSGTRQVFLLTYICEIRAWGNCFEAVSGNEIQPGPSQGSTMLQAPPGCAWFSPKDIPGLETISGTVEIVEAWTVGCRPEPSKPGQACFNGITPGNDDTRFDGDDAFSGSLRPDALPVGKVSPEVLEDFIGRLKTGVAEGILVGPSTGEDAAVIETDSKTLILTADPITFVTDRPARYCVHVNANDIAAMGGIPKYLILVVLIPEDGGWTPGDLMNLADDVRTACASIGVAVIGGHTEVTGAVRFPVLVGQMTGIPGPAGIFRTAGAHPGDALILTRPPGIEGTAILASEKLREVVFALGEEFAARCAGFLDDPGISVIPEAGILASLPSGPDGSSPVRALHDLTEGGLFAGVWEMARSSGVGLSLNLDLVKILPETLGLCELFGLDPGVLISSGALVAAVDCTRVDEILEALRVRCPHAAVIGEFTDEEAGIRILSGGIRREIMPPGPDEITRVLRE